MGGKGNVHKSGYSTASPAFLSIANDHDFLLDLNMKLILTDVLCDIIQAEQVGNRLCVHCIKQCNHVLFPSTYQYPRPLHMRFPVPRNGGVSWSATYKLWLGFTRHGY